jgi:hypothetical protein
MPRWIRIGLSKDGSFTVPAMHVDPPDFLVNDAPRISSSSFFLVHVSHDRSQEKEESGDWRKK